ncbi:hypothetical protein DXA74_05600 [Bacteroides sp. OF04-15BH]|nr:hypothetical protein DXA74_05600 [Bacteroides sp. OF04-15BH]
MSTTDAQTIKYTVLKASDCKNGSLRKAFSIQDSVSQFIALENNVFEKRQTEIRNSHSEFKNRIIPRFEQVMLKTYSKRGIIL